MENPFWDVDEETQTIFFVELIVKYEQTENLNFSKSKRDSQAEMIFVKFVCFDFWIAEIAVLYRAVQRAVELLVRQ